VISAVIVTRGDVDLSPILDSLPFDDVVVWNNLEREDLAVYGRYAGIAEAKGDLIYVQDDDVIIDVDRLLAEYRDGDRLCNMDAGHPVPYPDSSLVGWGAIFPRGDPFKAFARYGAVHPTDSDEFYRCCDVVFTSLAPFRRVDLGRKNLLHAAGSHRMHRQANHYMERRNMTERCLALPRISVVIPTTGSGMLQAVVDSAQDADEIIVIWDGCDPHVVSHHKTVVTRVEGSNRERSDFGHTARMRGMELASGSHITFKDDHDAYLPGAVDLMREASAHSVRDESLSNP